jgi:DNA-binding NarL/FixJ family response regulator
MTFLLAEDNPSMRQSIKQFLSADVPDHHTFYEASDGSEAIELYDRFIPEWVLMDIEMHPVDGFTASKTIIESYPDAKIIILTSYDDPTFRKAASEAGTIAFVSKARLHDIPKILSAYAY